MLRNLVTNAIDHTEPGTHRPIVLRSTRRHHLRQIGERELPRRQQRQPTEHQPLHVGHHLREQGRDPLIDLSSQ